ncbi:aromatic-ring-hydroxylating dioxygenase subunit beta [Parasphingopyxis lamellibrachiae]|uniref:Anthranilate 1,2-dioxygenase small subunit n=1 Tax=Parasphingopyxis lamellibrachiae TaxID=680125 RepID=A0A3D9F8Z6_9SPHN|nr:aromatic-ring-hydroxylating dioxygenase subunit beta [Parasphingopyxis lamellibrachiae]RED13358.1 anthranilate 1,2-dioxygenase small subunit [Parasphingopyxis lamellibrachiae]
MMNAVCDTSSPVQDLLERYVDCLDEDRLEEWPELFLENGLYKILSRENEAMGLPAPLVYYYSRGMMEDRVTALRDALTYEFVYSRHLITNTRISARDDIIEASSNFVIFHTCEEGRSKTYAVGRYRDVIVETDDGPKFKKRTVILDTFAVQNLIAAPL